MATAEDILKKSKVKQTKFQPVQRRSWDYDYDIDDPKNNITNEITSKNPDGKSKLVEDKISKLMDIDIDDVLKKENIDSPTKEALQKKLLTLTGHQKEIMRLITSHIKSRGGAPYTVGVFPNILAIKIKANIEVAKVSLKRLVEKNLLIRLKGEKGRNGCCKFKAREDVVKACFSLFNDSPCDINLIGNDSEKQ